MGKSNACRTALAFLVAVSLGACGDRPWNNPYPASDDHRNILYSSFSEKPKHLDPAQSYSSNEVVFTGQIYEPPLQYDYLKRPYELVPLTAVALPQPVFVDRNGQTLPDDAAPDQIAFSIYDIRIRAGVRYQPHPALATDARGGFLYHALSADAVAKIRTLRDFAQTGSRELVAADYVYQIKRLAHPKLQSPIFGLMTEYIVGLKEYGETLAAAKAQGDREFLDLAEYPLEGAQVVDRYTYRLKVRGKYPQMLYWLAMPFFAPVPPEADRFYAQPGFAEKNLSLDWWPVGTGPYMLVENNPNRQMVMDRNPNFHGEVYPAAGEAGDAAAGLLADAGKPLPFIERVVFSLEKESIPYWNKFQQGYYDSSGISSDSFDQAIRFGAGGEATLTDEMQSKGMRLQTAVGASTYYFGFNMLDPVVGGDSERARKLRQAVSIALDYEEYISIFLNGRGIPAQGPIPPGIFGYVDSATGINPFVYDWVGNAPQRKALEIARRLLAEAGYPDGRDAATGNALVLHYDVPASSGPDDKARLDWMRKQFRKLNIELDIRNTDYNRFQDKMRTGAAQLFQWGWNADYPDPENFLFLLYGPNGKVRHNGENAANYASAEFDRLFERMKNMENGPERQRVIDDMMAIARRDAPWIWGFHPKQFGLYHTWYYNTKPNLMANNALKFTRIDPVQRAEKRTEWNKPVVWPVILVVALLVVGTLPAIRVYRRRQQAAATA
ncbi:MAG: extracellular solute-binding protein [Gammaproteobacteria bacterium]|nr:MAG: extracellular solute-binding protein [Gammaproteobacteria bacterium]TND05000.1 MAG: extracellular solute-binding protein [Gammaproteobacteria bacterium]